MCQAQIFKEYRVVILRDLFSKDATDMVLQSLRDLHCNWSAKYDKDQIGNRLAGRYDMGSAYNTHHLTHLAGYLEALQDFADRGTLCLAHTDNWQPLHSDMRGPWCRELEFLRDQPEHVPCIDLMFTVHPLTSKNGAMRIVPGQPSVDKVYLQHQCCQAPTLEEESEEFKSSQLYPLPAGCGIFRDIRVWHGGVPNSSDRDRYIPILQFYSNWCVDACAANPSEGRGIDAETVCCKLSPEAQQLVAQHIIRQQEDDEPWLNLRKAIWVGAFY
eukprot:gnl/TRDRNA2_/TRDRNA2_149554_c0_seq2.p1 gnl/TRDRNA2_/TRDRNA2_149554_c0~~gnl/TRDRNA2_/TRDRNA2_149554_c0_seq2.p1  ORF type:complete len:272 (-),score=27.22 gnl/TRDRNA2_/TRDRNA2_149554_c0_seq2:137-952(-)